METPLPATDAGAARAPGTGSAPPRLPRLLLGYLPLYLFLFLVGAEMYLVAPLLPTVAADIGVPVAGAAQLVTAYVLVQAVAGPPLGLANSRWGPRRMVGIGASLFIAGNATAALSGDYGVLIASRAAAGFGVAMAGPAIWAWIAASAPEAVRGTAMGAGMGAFALGQVLGVPVGGFAADLAGWHSPFALLGAAALAALPLMLYGLRHSGEHHRHQRAQDTGARVLWRVWTRARLRRALIVTFLFHAASLGAYTYLPDILGSRYELSTSALGAVGLLSGLGMFIGASLGGRFGDAVRARGRGEAVLLPLWATTLLVTLTVAVGPRSLWLNLAAVLVWFIAAGAFDTNQQTLVASHSDGFTAVALSWNLAVLYAAASWGVWLMGVHGVSVTAVIGMGTVMAALAVVIAVLGAWRAR
ncbi:MFS transporter [Streptomyces noursei]|uniref:MFS transporter n=1 Tax=Streptomyces noursei TaxID=1971 RepID=UPI003800806A